MKIIAHRCRGYGHAENSILAIRAALEDDVDGIEIDIRLTSDRKWVAIHDPYYSDEEKNVRRVHERRLSQIRREVTPLDDILALHAALGRGRPIYLDVKDVGETRQLARMIKRHDLVRDTVIIAWEPEVLKRVHKELPTLRLGFSYVPIHDRLKGVKIKAKRPLGKSRVLLRFNELHSFDTKFRLGSTHQHYLSDLPDLPLYSIQVFSLFCSYKLVRRAHDRGLKVVAFTVNKSIHARLLKRRDVDAILSDKPSNFI